MSLYAIGDLHLSFTVDKPMSIYGREWENHVAKIEKNWKKRIREQDNTTIDFINYEKIIVFWISSPHCPGRRSCLGGTMICSGTLKRPVS